MKSEFLLAFNQICSERNLPKEVVLEALQMALVSAYRRSVGASASQNITAHIDPETGQASILVEREVVEEIADPQSQIRLVDARQLRPEVAPGDVVLVDSTPEDFGRIAAQTARQVVLQRIREAEREAQYNRYAQQEGEIIHGTVQSITPQAVTLNLGRTEAILPRSQQVPGERCTLHQRLRAYVMEVRKTSRGPQIIVSRSHKNMLRRLLELEVPEIFNGAVEIKAIAREAGSRSKVAVAANQLGVDPVGACVGMRGVRIQSIVNELGGEKIDIIEWNPDSATFIAKALSPAKVLSVHLEEDPKEGRTASVVVPDDHLSLAIGRAGQNARLAAKLTGWRIDIQNVTEAATWALSRVNKDPAVLPSMGAAADLLPTVAGILREHETDEMPYNSEELLTLRQVIAAVQAHYTAIRDAERARRVAEEAARRAAIEAAEVERRAAITAAIMHIPPAAYDMALSELGLSTRVFNHLDRAGLTNVGQVLERLAKGDERLLKLDGIGPKSLSEVKSCIEVLELPEVEPEVKEAAPPEEELPPAEEVTVVEAEIEAEAEPVVGELPPEVEVAAEVEVEPEEEAAAPPVFEVEFEEEEIEPELERVERKRERRPHRELVYDEELGRMVAVRRRKGRRARDEWEEYLE